MADLESLLSDASLEAKLAALGCSLISIPAPTGEELHRLEGWRDNIERYGQALWSIYHWIVKAQDGNTHGIYRLADWLNDFGVPDKTPPEKRGEFPVWFDL